MTTNFTPGPWTIRESMTQIGKCYRISTEPIIECGHGAALLYDDNTSLNPHAEGVQRANANLIAAAPELYKALYDLVHGGSPDGRGSEWDRAEAALAKADGGQQ